MPPRVSRSKWSCLFPRHDPIPFLHPRWFATDAAAVIDSRPTRQVPRGQHVEEEAQVQVQGQEQEQEDAKDQPKSLIRKYPSKQETPNLIRKITVKNEARERRESQRKKLRNNNFDADDWRTPLAYLRRNTSDDPAHHVKQLERLNMPEGMRGFYDGDLHQLFLHVYLHTHCHVQVSRWGRGGEKTTTFDSLELAGTRSAIELAKNILNDNIKVRRELDHLKKRGKGKHVKEKDKEREQEKDVGVNDTMGAYETTTTSITRDKAAPRSVWAIRSARRIQLDKVQRPSRWSTSGFANYVDDLVNSAKPRLDRTKLDKGHKSHVDTVTEKLLDAFLDETNLPFISSHACTTAMQYLVQHRKIPEVRRIFEAMDNGSVILTPAVFNVMLHSAAEARDMHNYTFLLQIMLDRKVLPDHDTWAALVLIVQHRSRRNTKHIISAMRHRGLLLNHSAKISLANALIPKDFTEWLIRGDSVQDFLGHYDKTWGGTEWLDTRAANTLLLILLGRGHLEDITLILDTLCSRGHQPNLVTLNTLLSGAATLKNDSLALEALESIQARYPSITYDETTYHQLACLAWNKRCINLLRVTWRHACITGHMSYFFRKRIQQSLCLPLPPSQPEPLVSSTGTGDDTLPSASRSQAFRSVAAKVALGIDTTYSVSSFDPVLHGETMKTRSKNAALFLEKDFAAARVLGTRASLVEDVREALQLDKRWALQGLGKNVKGLDWLLRNAVPVRVLV